MVPKSHEPIPIARAPLNHRNMVVIMPYLLIENPQLSPICSHTKSQEKTKTTLEAERRVGFGVYLKLITAEQTVGTCAWPCHRIEKCLNGSRRGYRSTAELESPTAC